MELKKGFTLVELLVAMAVSAIVLLGVISMFSSILKAEDQLDSYVQAQDSVRIISITVEKDIRTSSQQIVISNSGTCTIIEDTNALEVIEYCLSNKNLTRNDQHIGSNIKVFSVYQENEMIKLLVESEYKKEVIRHEKAIHLR